MRSNNSYGKSTRVFLSPVENKINKFPTGFSGALIASGLSVFGFRWSIFKLFAADVVVFHWPNEFFAGNGLRDIAESIPKLIALRFCRTVLRTRFIWVAHNAAPHDAKTSAPWLTRLFLRSLDGVIFLSAHSRELVWKLYPECRRLQSLVTVHGHYRGLMETPETPRPALGADVRIVYFGQIRPYKNVELLAAVVAEMDEGVRLLIRGMVLDRSLREAISAQSKGSDRIELDLRATPLTDAELEATIDGADAVILPYRNVLNSGAALLALSRNRPVLAPNIGSLPELREKVGAEWVHLYDGELRREVLVDFLETLRRTPCGTRAPLRAFDWDVIGREVAGFISHVAAR